jgi:DNA-binding HxlR family transcriptional regulator
MTEYSLTDQGKELQKILESLGEWGMKYAPPSR